MRILTVPGWTGSGPAHWQTLWERSSPLISRVVQRDWDRPIRTEWVAELDRVIRSGDSPVLLVAHSLGCATVVHWFASHPNSSRVVGALLVAPADVDRRGWPIEVEGFRPMPLNPLNAHTVVVASRDDPWVLHDRARAFSAVWGSQFVDAGSAGHMDSQAGLDHWPAGWRLLCELVERFGCSL